MTRTPIPDCPQPETPIRDRAWTDGQKLADVRERAKALLDALDETYWSSWQSTAKFSGPMESLREILNGATP
jgi:hypothetical protein